jgi:hypothetical protein
MSRILSRCGNVIAADFRPSPDLTVKFKNDILYCDDAVVLMRMSATFAGKLFMICHFMGDLKTGAVVQV